MKREELPNEVSREDKMREALAHYEELATKACWHRSDIPEAIRAYYAPLPPAEGVEEILEGQLEILQEAGFKIPLKHGTIYNRIIDAMHEFATLHAQRLAEKMVEERLREELIKYSMYASEQWCDTSDRELSEKNIDKYLKSRER